jgi:hypothetical protein
MLNQDKKYVDILLTDIQLHSNKMERSSSFSKLVSKAVKNNALGRMYLRGISLTKDGKIILPLFPNSEIQKIKEKYEKEGKIVRFFIHKSGLFMGLGKDTLEYLAAQKKMMLDKTSS